MRRFIAFVLRNSLAILLLAALSGFVPFVLTMLQHRSISHTPGYARAYCSIYASHATVAQGSLGTTPVKVTGFVAVGPSRRCVPDHENDQLTIGVTGTYQVFFTTSFSGTANAIIHIHVRVDGVEQTIGIQRKLSGGDMGSAAAAGIMNLTLGEVVTMYIETADVGQNDAITPSELGLHLHRVE